MAKKVQYHFVLSKEDMKSGLKEHMDEFVQKKKLTSRIKTALTLLAQLEQGNYEMLDSMFPSVRKPASPTGTPDTGDLERRIADAVEARFYIIVEKGILPATPKVAMPAALTQPAPKQLAGANMTLPLPEPDLDDEATIVLNKASGGGDIRDMMATLFSMGVDGTPHQ